MLRLLKHLVLVLIFVVAAGCSGGGCSSGCSCGGITPLAEGFDPARRIENAASLRVTDSGVTFLEDNLGTLAGVMLGNSGGTLSFEVPPSSGSQFGISYDVCPDGPKPNANPPECVAEVDLASSALTLTPTADHDIVITGPLKVRLQNLPMHIVYFFIPSDINAVLNGNDSCPGDNETFADVGITVNVSITIDGDQTHSRYGYSRVGVQFNLVQDDVKNQLHFCGGFDASLLNALKGILLPMLIDPLISTLQGTIEDSLCQQANPDLNPPCPNGTTNVDGVCRYGADASAECASIILGMDGNIDLGGLLASFSPGTRGAFDFLFAGGGDTVRSDGTGEHYGDLNPIAQGISLSMYGGAEPTPTSSCVPLVDMPLPAAIPVPAAVLGNTVADWPANLEGPHVGIALSERYTNYALAQMYNSGGLCLGITADALGPAVPLSTSLIGIGLAAPSLNELALQKQPAPIAIVVRPQSPPHVEFGNGTDIATDPLIHLTMDKAVFDFYTWTLDRYVRALSATMDLDIPINLEVTPDGLQPMIDQIGVSNAVVTNSELLREDPAKLAEALQGLLESMVGSLLGGALPPIDVSGQLSSLGLTLDIPPTVDGQGSPGLRKLTEDTDDFLGIFATLGVATQNVTQLPPPASKPGSLSLTTAQLVDLQIDPAGLRIESYREDNGPQATLRLGSSLDDGMHTIEWQYKLDRGPWHPFTRRRTLLVDDEWLRTQGRHIVSVRSRVVGQMRSLDPAAVEIPVLIDAEPPQVEVVEDDAGEVSVRVRDRVSDEAHSQVRLRLGYQSGGELQWDDWSDWVTTDALAPLDPGDATDVEVQARDESENVGSVRQALIRGRASTAGSGCQCALSEQPRAPSWPGWLLGALVGLGGLGRRRRRSSRGRATSGATARRTIALVALVTLPGLWVGCSCGDDAIVGSGGCRERGDCEVLLPGLVGAYTSAATAPDGTVWVAGYLEANWEDGYTWGDLVVGRLEGDSVAWKAIDGVPGEPAVNAEQFDPQGFRGGQTEAGDDVGLWTSLAMDEAGQPGVAYYDASHMALRYAHRDSNGWTTTMVQDAELGDFGRYAKLVYLGGKPTIAFLFIESGDKGAVHSGVRLATGSSADAAQASWTFDDVASNPTTPCRDDLCPTGMACVASTQSCLTKKTDCSAECSSGDKCVDVSGTSQCETIISSGQLISYPDAFGLYISAAMRPGGDLGLAFYDRIGGNVMIATRASGQWTTLVADGESGGQDTGDKGVGTSLFVDAEDNFHLAYVDGLTESLDYLMVTGGTTPGAPEIVDDGLGDGDGQHLVGDDANLLVTQGGEIHISYQDATTGKLRLAVGTSSGGQHQWALSTIDQSGFAGFFSRQIEVDGSVRVLNWWRVASPAAKGDVRLLSP